MYRRIALGEVGSTNSVALERIEQGETAPFWVTAERQLEGRGRLGRAWVSEPGNLYATLALDDPAPAESLATLSIVAAVSVRRAIVEATGAVAVELKWPNDVMLAGAKIAGILLEAQVVNGRRHVLIGCGVNCASHPDGVAYPATDLANAGYPVGPDRLFTSLNKQMTAALAAWNRGERTEPFIEEWLACAHRMGERVTVTAPTGAVTGTLHGLDAMGRLLLDTDDGRVTIVAGDLEPPLAE